jgi:hypothetical protein
MSHRFLKVTSPIVLSLLFSCAGRSLPDNREPAAIRPDLYDYAFNTIFKRESAALRADKSKDFARKYEGQDFKKIKLIYEFNVNTLKDDEIGSYTFRSFTELVELPMSAFLKYQDSYYLAFNGEYKNREITDRNWFSLRVAKDDMEQSLHDDVVGLVKCPDEKAIPIHKDILEKELLNYVAQRDSSKAEFEVAETKAKKSLGDKYVELQHHVNHTKGAIEELNRCIRVRAESAKKKKKKH